MSLAPDIKNTQMKQNSQANQNNQSNRANQAASPAQAPAAQAKPADPAKAISPASYRAITLGLGCDRNTPATTIQQCVAEALQACDAILDDVVAVASIDLKADETGLLAYVAQQGWPLRFFTAAELAQVEVPNPSETVRKYTGTPSVSEAAALLIAQTDASQLLIEKHRLRGPDGRNATVSIALARQNPDFQS